MVFSNFHTRFCLLVLCLAAAFSASAQCPNLNQTATLTSAQCAPGLTPCHLCPGHQMTLAATGTGLPGGGCVDWYYGTTNNFNPYDGEGTLLGCSAIPGAPPPLPCDNCPTTIMLFVDACGTEQDNEFMLSWSGSGFNVDQVTIDLPVQNNFNLPNDDDLGSTNCPFQEPTPAAITSVQSACPGATVIGVGPGETVPANVPVVTFMSDNISFAYNGGGLCPLSPTIYVMQNSCSRLAGAFSNKNSAPGTRTITFALDCGCSDASTYNLGSLTAGANGDFFIDANLPLGPLAYGNVGCGFPPLPFNPPPPPTPVVPTPFTATITADMCNGGPYWVVGIVDPLNANCNEVFTNYLPFNVVCPDPILLDAQICSNSGIFNLNTLEDPAWPNGTWAGPGVVGNNFNPSGQSGTVNLTFTPAAPCAVPTPTTIEVFPAPTAQILAPSPICANTPIDLTINFTGTAPWGFELTENGSSLGIFATNDNPFIFPITLTGNTQIRVQDLTDSENCSGSDAQVNLTVAPPIFGDLSLIGSGSLCPGQTTTLAVNFTGGSAPYSFFYTANGIDQNLITTSSDPYVFSVSPSQSTDYVLVFVEANGCEGTAGGTAAVLVSDPPVGLLPDNDLSICQGQSVNLTFNFTGDPPYVFVYSINNVNQPAITTNNSNHTLTVTPPAGTTIYELENLTSNGCVGTGDGIVEVTANPAPTATISGNSTICTAGGSAILTIELDGDAPFTFTYSANGVPQLPAITTNLSTYLLPVSPTVTTEYVLTSLTGAGGGGCPGTFSGMATVSIGNPLSATISGGGQICQNGNGTTISISFVGDGPYQFVYSINNVAQPQILTSSNPHIINVNPNIGSIYRLVSVSNAAGCTGTFSGQANVFVFTPPTADLIPVSGSFCSPAITEIPVDFTGTGPFTIIYSINNQQFDTVETSEDPYFIPVNVSQTTTYTLLQVMSPGCVGNPQGSTTVNVLPQTNFSNVNLICNPSNGTYQVEFDISGNGPFTILSGGGSIDANFHYTSPPIPQANNYTITFKDAPNCDTLTVAGVSTCNCTTNAGALAVEPADTLCRTAPAMANFLGGQFLDANDSLFFILHTNAATPPGQILAWSNTPQFNFQNGMTTGQTYFISAVAGDKILPDSIDLADLCLDFSNSKSVVWMEQPSILFQPDLTICSGDSAHVTVSFTGTPPFTFAANLGSLGTAIINDWLSNTYTFHFLPTANTTVSIVNFEDKFCPDGNVSDVVNINLTPPLEIQNLQTTCNFPNQNYVVEFTLAGGTPPYNITGSAGNLSGSSFTSAAIPAGTPFQFIANGLCGVDTISGNPDCACPPLEIGNLETHCSPSTGTYSFSFTVTQGQPPFSMNGFLGSFSGNVWTSASFSSQNNCDFEFVLTDANGCDTIQMTENCGCTCATEAGAMAQNPLSLCLPETADGTFLGGQNLTFGDTSYFILHTDATAVGNILATSQTPSFDFIAGSMFEGIPYYISLIVGKKDPANGNQVLLTDPCLDIAAGQPVVWHQPPTAQILSQNFDICPGASQPVTIFFTGKPTYNFTYTLNGAPVPSQSLTNSFTVNTTILQNTSIGLSFVSDANGCVGTTSGSAQINVHTTPQIENVVVNCSPDNLSYTVEFDVTNADLPSVVIAGSLGGNFDKTTGHFVSGPVPTGNPYDARVSDIWNCGQDTIAGVPDCQCLTNSGSMSQQQREFCAQETAVVSPATGTFLDQNDTLVYVLATEQAPPTWTILGANSVPSFSFNAGLMNVGQVYFVVPVAANKTPAGIDFSDPCRSFGIGTPVLWKKPVTAFLSGNLEICQGDTASLKIIFEGNPPYQFSYLINGVPQTALVSSLDTFILKVNPTFSANYSLTHVIGEGCLGVVSGGAAVSVLLPPDLIDVEQICDFVNQTYVLKFKIANGVAPNPQYSVSGLAGSVVDTIFTSQPIPFSQNFNLTVSTPIGCEKTLTGANTCKCTSDAGTLNTAQIVEACTGESVIVQSNGNFQLDGNDAFQYVLYSDPTTFPNGILATSFAPQFAFQTGMVAGQIYYVSAVAGDKVLPANTVNLTDPCLSVSPPVQVRFVAGPTALISGNFSVCPGEAVQIPVSFTGAGPFNFVYALNGQNQLPIQSPQSQFQISSSNILDNQTFSLVSVTNGVCPGTVGGTALVNLKATPTGSLTGGETVCPNTPVGLILNLGGLPAGTLFDVLVSDGTGNLPLTGIQNGFVLNVSPAATTTYTIVSISAAGTDCPAKIGASATVTVVPLVPDVFVKTQNGGFAVSCNGFADGKATATATGGQQPYLFQWSGNQQQGELVDVPAGKYFVTVTDAKGCSAIDSVEINEPPAINLIWKSTAPQCFGKDNGSITIEEVSGGAVPYSVSLNGQNGQVASNFPLILTNLATGNYLIEVEDANGCLAEQQGNVPDGEEISVSVGDDISLAFGDSTVLNGQIDAVALDTFFWTPTQFLSNPASPKPIAKPFQTMIYKLVATDTFGCSASDEVLVKVERQNRVFVPNAIKTGEGTINEFFTIFGGAELVSIRSMKIFDRWGEQVFSGKDMLPGEIPKGWDGYWKEKWLMPGVYVYVAELVFVDGSTETISGDVTIVR